MSDVNLFLSNSLALYETRASPSSSPNLSLADVTSPSPSPNLSLGNPNLFLFLSQPLFGKPEPLPLPLSTTLCQMFTSPSSSPNHSRSDVDLCLSQPLPLPKIMQPLLKLFLSLALSGEGEEKIITLLIIAGKHRACFR